jgi:hypothetical protein
MEDPAWHLQGLADTALAAPEAPPPLSRGAPRLPRGAAHHHFHHPGRGAGALHCTGPGCRRTALHWAGVPGPQMICDVTGPGHRRLEPRGADRPPPLSAGLPLLGSLHCRAFRSHAGAGAFLWRPLLRTAILRCSASRLHKCRTRLKQYALSA